MLSTAALLLSMKLLFFRWASWQKSWRPPSLSHLQVLPKEVLVLKNITRFFFFPSHYLLTKVYCNLIPSCNIWSAQKLEASCVSVQAIPAVWVAGAGSLCPRHGCLLPCCTLQVSCPPPSWITAGLLRALLLVCQAHPGVWAVTRHVKQQKLDLSLLTLTLEEGDWGREDCSVVRSAVIGEVSI